MSSDEWVGCNGHVGVDAINAGPWKIVSKVVPPFSPFHSGRSLGWRYLSSS